MQLARNFFLSSEKTLTRKLYEALLAFKIESTLSKDQILEIYLNQIYLGQRAYGFAPRLPDLLRQVARRPDAWPRPRCSPGFPKAPSSFNPVVNPKRAKQRQLYVLRRMHELGYINDDQLAAAQKAARRTPRHRRIRGARRARRRDGPAGPLRALPGRCLQPRVPRLHDDHQARSGSRLSVAAARGARLRPPARLPRPRGLCRPAQGAPEEPLEEVLQEFADSEDLLAAVVLEAGPKQVKAYRRGGDIVTITEAGLRFAASSLAEKTLAEPPHPPRRGDPDPEGREARLADPAATRRRGGVRRARSADRRGARARGRLRLRPQQVQPRHPGVAPARARRSSRSSTRRRSRRASPRRRSSTTRRWSWTPRSPAGRYGSRRTTTASTKGPMRLRMALAKSKNMVSVRVLQSIGTQYAQDYVTRFGFDADKHPPYLTLALGAGSVTPWQMARAYARIRERRLPDRPIPHREDRRRPRQPARAGAAGEGGRPEPARDRRAQRVHHGQHDARRRAHGHRARARRRSDARISPAKPARPTTTSTRGSRATSRGSSASPGSASTSRRSSAQTRPAAPQRCRSGWATCGPRSRACRRCSPSHRPA